MLWKLIQPAAGAIQFSEELPGDGKDVYTAVDRMGFEGMISNQRTSPYCSGPTMPWRRIKCYESDEFEIIGVELECGNVPVALLNKGGKYAGSAIVSLTVSCASDYGNGSPPSRARHRERWRSSAGRRSGSSPAWWPRCAT